LTITIGDDNITELLTAKEAGEYLRTTRQHIYKLINSGEITGFKNDTGKYLIFGDSLENYIKRCYNVYAQNSVIPGGTNHV